MARKLRPATLGQALSLAQARGNLMLARDIVKAAGCPQTAKAISRALASLGGAQRHMQRRYDHARNVETTAQYRKRTGLGSKQFA